MMLSRLIERLVEAQGPVDRPVVFHTDATVELEVVSIWVGDDAVEIDLDPPEPDPEIERCPGTVDAFDDAIRSPGPGAR